ncbi:transposase [Bradyrhizobium sp. cir1]|uniref:hypothetical protein n=1 Tax=Bradyrhizobium sp. cir1 TaxID=1445730 RepID=UPI001605C37D|nr:hypothetical protein [Bradyrhizobium sp. cir1]MBB4373434.1 transposase [Bradyrhizobium sp. cir1]
MDGQAIFSGFSSLDFRKSVVAAIEGGLSRNRAAEQFGGQQHGDWLLEAGRRDSNVEPSKIGGHKPKAISGEYAEIGGFDPLRQPDL